MKFLILKFEPKKLKNIKNTKKLKNDKKRQK